LIWEITITSIKDPLPSNSQYAATVNFG